MNTFDLMNIAFLPLERRHDSSRAAATTQHSQDETGKEGSPPADPRTAGVSVPTQCSKCGPSCTCHIAWNE